jgi:hypothetical protein
VLLLELCSLESPLGELSLELDAEWCSLVVSGATTIGAGAATTIGAGATTTGAGYTATTGGAGATFVVSLELVVLEVCANPTATIPNNSTIPMAAVFKCFTMTISVSPTDDRSIPE